MKQTGVIIARFQTPYLHEGHCKLINAVIEKHNKVVIVLGVSMVKGSTRNPFDFHVRECMVKKQYPNVVVLPLPDTRLDTAWSHNLDSLLSITFPRESFMLYGSRDSFIKNYHGKNPITELAENKDQSATSLREQMSDRVGDTTDFRAGIIYAYSNTYPKVYATLDVALFRNQYSELLLGRRDAEGLWRLPGGFSDPTDENYEAAALRELREECGQIEVDNLCYEGSFKVDDWRYRQETDKIITLLFSCAHLSGNSEGNDDIDEVKWFSLPELLELVNTKEVVEEHIPQLNKLIKKYSSELINF